METPSQTKTISAPPLYSVEPDGRWTFHFDNHAGSTFDTCQRKFQYSFLYEGNLRLSQKGPGSFVIALGSWWSKVMEDYYELFARDGLLLQRALGQGVLHWESMKMDEFTLTEPKAFEKFGGRAGAMAMIKQYFDFYYEIDRRSIKVIATEAGFGLRSEVFVGESDRVRVFHTGKPDLVLLEDDKYLMPMDHKQTDSITDNLIADYKPDSQLYGYVFALREMAKAAGYKYEVNRYCINFAARSIPTDKPRNGKVKPRFLRVRPFVSPSEIGEWRSERVGLAERMRDAIEIGFFPKTSNRVSCHHHYGKPCPFRDLCATPAQHRPDKIRANYIAGEAWIPYKVSESSE